MADRIIIFGKAGWPFTERARSAYGWGAEYYDVKADRLKMDEMLKYSGGQRKVPVIVEDGKVTIGYNGAWGVWPPAGCRRDNRFYL
jgi:glutaredoxin 3